MGELTQPVREQENTAYQHRPLSTILAPAAEPAPKEPSKQTPSAPVADKVEDTPLPEKYMGKTVEQVAEMHMNAEKELGRVRNEVGTYRGLVNDLSQLQTKTPETTPAQEELDVSGDDLITDPVGTVRKIVKQDFDALAAQSAQQVEGAQFSTENAALMQRFPGMDATIQSPEFQAFASRTPSRQADYRAAAATGTGVTQVRAASRLLEDFEDFSTEMASTTQKPEQTPTELAKQVSTEGGGGSGPVTTLPLIYEADVIALINSDPTKYRSPSFQTELMAAIKEGRYVKQT